MNTSFFRIIVFIILLSKILFPQTAEQKKFLMEFAKEQNEIWLNKKLFADSVAKANGVPIYFEYDDGSIIELQEFTDGQYIYHQTDNQIAAQSVSTDKVYSTGIGVFNLNGYNQKFGLWEAGGIPLLNHQELVGRITVRDGTSNVTQHATHVAGTLIASGIVPSAKGMSFSGYIDSYNSSNDLSEISSAAANGLKVSNHSYGNIVGWRDNYFNDGKWAWFGDVNISPTVDYKFGFYNNTSAAWDNMLFNAPYLLVTKSAGNDRGEGPAAGTEHWVNINGSWVLSNDVRERDGGALGYDCINDSRGIAKNTLTIGAVNDVVNGYNGPNSVTMSSFSNWGPTDDGRIKPDLVGNGVGLNSSSNGSTIQYASLSGTSMSTPNIAGSIGLLLQLRDSLYSTQTPFLASTIKALLLHTADECGTNPGPDYVFGWGLMNTMNAALMLKLDSELGKFVLIKEDTLLQGNQLTYQYSSNGNFPLKFTINWFDRPGTPTIPSLNPTTKMLVNDLDIRVTGPTGIIHMSWVLNPSSPASAAAFGDNITDNTEQVFIDNPLPGNYSVTISHKGSLVGSQQIFSLIVSGVEVSLPDSVVTISPANGASGISTSALLKWAASNKATEYELEVSEDSTFANILFTEKNIKDLSKLVLSLHALDTIYWRVRGWNSGGAGQWSSVSMFMTMVAPPVIPNLIYPSQNAVHIPDSLTFIWDSQPNVSNYQLQISTSLLFTNILRNDSAISSPSHTVSNLNDGSRFYWRVRAINEAGVSDYSSRYQFITKLKKPDSLKIVSFSNYSVQLNWIDKSNNETRYFVLRAVNNNSFTKLDSLPANTVTYTDSNVSVSNTYRYKIYAANNIAVSDTTNEVFVNITKTSDENLPHEFALDQNHPNPFNPSTTISFSLASESAVNLKIYNLLGEEVITLIKNQTMSAGRYSVFLDASKLTSGVYIYRLEADAAPLKAGSKFTQTKKMTLIK